MGHDAVEMSFLLSRYRPFAPATNGTHCSLDVTSCRLDGPALTSSDGHGERGGGLVFT